LKKTICLLSLLSLVLMGRPAYCAEQDSVRIKRPASSSSNNNRSEPASLCSLRADNERLNLEIVDGYRRWLERYINPVFCPVDICHGSCAAYDDACLLSGSQPVLSYFGELDGFALRGCGGACSQSHGQANSDISNASRQVGSCCH